MLESNQPRLPEVHQYFRCNINGGNDKDSYLWFSLKDIVTTRVYIVSDSCDDCMIATYIPQIRLCVPIMLDEIVLNLQGVLLRQKIHLAIHDCKSVTLIP